MCPIDFLEESGGIGLRSFHGIPPSAYITAHESRWCDGILRLFFLPCLFLEGKNNRDCWELLHKYQKGPTLWEDACAYLCYPPDA